MGSRTEARGTPKAVLGMLPGIDAEVLTADAVARLREHVDLVAVSPHGLLATPDEVLRDVEVLVGGWGCPRLDAGTLDRLPRLRLLSYAAGTVKSTVTDEVWARGIAVSSAAEANAIPVAELTFAAVVMIAKDVFRVRDQHRAGRGAEPARGVGPGRAVGTRGLKVGIVGASRVGRLVIERLHTLDGEVAVIDPFLEDAEAVALGVRRLELDELCRWADIVSVHAPELPETRHMIGAEQLAGMRDGTWLLNTARGSLVDTAALERECVAGRLCAWIDTADPEPLPSSSPLYDLDNVVLTPHIAGSLGTEISRLGDLAVAEVARFVAGEPRRHVVLAADLDRIA